MAVKRLVVVALECFALPPPLPSREEPSPLLCSDKLAIIFQKVVKQLIWSPSYILPRSFPTL